MPIEGAVRLQRLEGNAHTSRGLRRFRHPLDQVFLKTPASGTPDGEMVVGQVGRHKDAKMTFIVSNMSDEDRQKVLDEVIRLRAEEMAANPGMADITPSNVLTRGLPNDEELEEVFEVLEDRHKARRKVEEGEDRDPNLEEEREVGEE